MTYKVFLFICTLFLFSCDKKTVQDLKQKDELVFSKKFPKGQKKFKFYDDFNTNKLKKSWRKEITKNNEYIIDVDSKTGRFSDGYLISKMNQTGKGGVAKRAELSIKLFDSINQVKFLSFSIKVPKTFKFEKSNLGRETLISQWHSKPAPDNTWQDYRKYNEFNKPSVALLLTTNDNVNFYLVLRYGNNGKPNFKHKDYVWSAIAISKINKGEWQDLVFEIKWSLTNKGYIASWINNKPFTPFNGLNNKVYGANMHNVSPTYFKLGQYRYWDDKNTNEVFYDEVRVGDNFKEVSLYKKLPSMVKEKENVDFIVDHRK